MEYTERKLANGKIIIDEMCKCGSPRTMHEDVHPIAAAGHGACPESGCAKFTWVGFVYKDGK